MISWSALLITSFQIGSTVLDIIKGSSFKRAGDRFIISVWIGMMIISNILLAISIFSRLSLLTVSLLFPTVILFSGLVSRRNYIKPLKAFLSSGIILGFFVLLIGISLVTTQVVVWFDTGGYHIGIIKWLSTCGAVPGVSLIYYGLGYTSSWFALAAPFNNWILEGRASTLTGGLAFLMLVLHLWISLVRVFTRRAETEDWFLVVSSLLALAVITRYEIYVTPSTDLPVIILTIVVSWTIFIIEKNRRQARRENRIDFSDNGIIPLLLSVGAFSIKPSALPILCVSITFYLYLQKNIYRSITKLVVIVFLPLLPFFVVQTITSGCLLYPSSLLCLDLPWTMGLEKLKAVSIQIIRAAQWDTITPPDTGSWKWVLQWPRREMYQVGLILLGIFIFPFSMKKLRNDAKYWAGWPLALGIIGIVYAIILGPTWRYDLGYLTVISGVLISLHSDKLNALLNKSLSYSEMKIPGRLISPILLFIMSITIVFLSLMVNHIEAFNSLRVRINEAARRGDISTKIYDRSRFIYPPRIVNFYLRIDDPKKFRFSVFDLELSKEKIGDFHIFKPKQGYQCWNSPLPCSQLVTYDDIRLRDPDRGICSGFVRIK